MGVYIKNWSLADWKELLHLAKIGANNAMIGEFTKIEEVPPHGRCVDADKLMQEMRLFVKENMLSRDDARELLETIEDAPTVIPAEEQSGNSGELED